MRSATERTLKHLKQHGYKTAIVEKYNAYAGEFGVRQDLLGIIDILAFEKGRLLWGVQSTTGSQYADHYRKITEEKCLNTALWLSIPSNRLLLYAWRKVKVKRGGKQTVWKPRITEITMRDLI